MDSSKKQTNEFVFTSMRRVFVRFLEEIEDSKKAFRNYLTFSAAVLLRCTKVTKNNAHFCVHTLMLMILISNGFVWLYNYFSLL